MTKYHFGWLRYLSLPGTLADGIEAIWIPKESRAHYNFVFSEKTYPEIQIIQYYWIIDLVSFLKSWKFWTVLEEFLNYLSHSSLCTQLLTHSWILQSHVVGGFDCQQSNMLLWVFWNIWKSQRFDMVYLLWVLVKSCTIFTWKYLFCKRNHFWNCK